MCVYIYILCVYTHTHPLHGAYYPSKQDGCLCAFLLIVNKEKDERTRREVRSHFVILFTLSGLLGHVDSITSAGRSTVNQYTCAPDPAFTEEFIFAETLSSLTGISSMNIEG